MASTGASTSVTSLNNNNNNNNNNNLDESSSSSSSTSSSSDIKTEYRSSTQYSFTPPPNSSSSTKNTKKEDDRKDDSMYECNICLDIAKDAVVSMCGHLYCWPCLNQWLETRPNRQLCPVCKAAISKDKVIPLYGRNSDKQDPRSKVPPRPQGQRSEAPPDNSYTPFNFNGGSDNGFHLSFGIGAFPFGFFTYGNLRPSGGLGHGGVNGIPQFNEDQYLSKVFLWLAILFLIWLILA